MVDVAATQVAASQERRGTTRYVLRRDAGGPLDAQRLGALRKYLEKLVVRRKAGATS